MKTMNNLPKEQKVEVNSPGNFFRDIEVEFLIHELKDPISIIETGMRTLLEKKEKYGSLSLRQEKTLKRTLRNTKKVREMLNGLLEIGRSEAGYFVCRRFQPAKSMYDVLLEVLETTSGNLSERVRNCSGEQEISGLLAEHGIFLKLEPLVIEQEMLQDETKFRQIFGNLVKNALHHRKNRIEIKMNQENDFLFIEISDDGPGVGPEHHQTIFQRYAQIQESSTLSRKGHGLGLAGALILARHLGGDIELHSTRGNGATFRLLLPMTLKSE